ncbi:MAG: M15 family metallopeptidase [Candidatus Scalindua sp.]
MRFLKQKFDLTSYASLPIPPLRNPEGWREINIHECAERLVPLSTINLDQIDVDSRYYKERYSNAMKECYVRETVARQLCKASEMLQPGWKIVIFDAWRPVELQLQIFEKYKTKLKNKYPEYPEHRLNQEVQRYISFPSSNLTCPSPHVSGGAVDLSLRDDSGKNLDMGTEFDAFCEESYTCYYELKLEQGGELTHQEQIRLENRRILYHTLTRVGFTNFPEEWWHFDYGNQFWARIKGKEAIYGITSLNEYSKLKRITRI